MNWQDKTSVKKGNIGEELVNAFLLNKGFVTYKPDEQAGAHPFDRLVAGKDKKTIFVAECKTKARRTYYPDTGINIRNYNDYANVRRKYNMEVFIFFVDEHSSDIYGNWLSELEKPRSINHAGKVLQYPLEQKGIIYFPIEAMRTIAKIPKQNAEELKCLSERNYNYEAES